MEQLYEKMLEFTKMTEELPFDQFQAYYQEVVDYLQKEYQGLNQEDLLKAKGICNIIAGNAVGRGARKDANSKKFKKMAENGDIIATNVKNAVDKIVTVKGYALCEVTTDNKKFNNFYVDTKEMGFIYTGSEYFKKSIIDYLPNTNKFMIKKLDTKKGTTYKAQPIIEENEVDTDVLPF